MAGNALLEPDLVGKRQDLSDMIYIADRKTTPGIASIKKGEPLSVWLYDYIAKSYGDRKRESPPDGKDVNAFDMQSPKVVLQARAEEFRRAPMVGEQAQAVSEAGGVAGTRNLFNEARADQMLEIGRDVEKAIWSSTDSRPSDGVNGSQFRGMDKWLSRGPFNELAVPAAAQIPANQIFSGSISDINVWNEDALGALIQAKYENTGASSDLRGFVTPIIKNAIGFFSRYQPNVTAYTSAVFVTTGKLQGNTLFGPTVDIYKSDWGTFELFPVLTDFMPSTRHGFFLDMDQPRIRVMGGAKEQRDLPDLGGGPRSLIKWILSLLPGHPPAHCKIAAAA